MSKVKIKTGGDTRTGSFGARPKMPLIQLPLVQHEPLNADTSSYRNNTIFLLQNKNHRVKDYTTEALYKEHVKEYCAKQNSCLKDHQILLITAQKKTWRLNKHEGLKIQSKRKQNQGSC